MSREVSLNEQTYFSLCQTAASLGVNIEQFSWVETAGERERLITCITQKKAAEAAQRQAEQEKQTRMRELCASLGQITDERITGFAYDESVITFRFFGCRYEIKEIE